VIKLVLTGRIPILTDFFLKTRITFYLHGNKEYKAFRKNLFNMKNTNTILTDQYSDILPEESSTQFNVRPYHIIGTALLLVAWAWLGTVIIS